MAQVVGENRVRAWGDDGVTVLESFGEVCGDGGAVEQRSRLARLSNRVGAEHGERQDGAEGGDADRREPGSTRAALEPIEARSERAGRGRDDERVREQPDAVERDDALDDEDGRHPERDSDRRGHRQPAEAVREHDADEERSDAGGREDERQIARP